MRLRLPAGRILAVAAILLMAAAFLPGSAPADHSGGLDCYSCHAFSAGIVEPGTQSMAKSAMTEIKTHGWSKGQRLSCTFCHRSVNATHIPDVLADFTTSGVSRHPVSRNFVTGAIDNTAYLSNDNTSFAQHLDCKDCHDTTLVSQPDHDNNWLANVGAAGRTKLTNPFGLKNVTAPKAYDDLCRNCHQSLAAFAAFTGKSGAGATKLVLAAHDNGADNTTNAIKDIDNTHLRTQAEWAGKRQCNICHDGHYSANSHLFSDGHELSWTGFSKDAISETTDCTTVCHVRGDAQGGYDTRGHGKATNWNGVALNRNCTFCHDASKPHLPASTDYSTKYRFPTLDNSWLTQSVFQKPIRSVCATCHPAGSYPLHQTSKGNVGCIDCHDQHAKSSDNNVMMVRNTNRVKGSLLGITGVGATVGSEPVLFAKSEKYPAGDNVFHFYTNVSYQGDTSAGFCDQRACHGAGKASDNVTPLVPLSGLMANSKHSGDNQAANTDCEACHKHADSGGSFRAVSSCTSCHGQPPPPADTTAGPTYFYNESFTPHPLHAGMSGYQINCRICHVRYTDGATHNTFQSLGVKTFQSVFFDGSVARGVSAYDNATLTCTNIYCHSDGRGGIPNAAAQWMTPGNATGSITLNCAGCHNGDGVHVVQRMSSGAHTTHLNNGHTCSACHVNTVSDDNVTLNPSTGIANHVNFLVNVTIRSSYDNDTNPANNWDNATKTCSGVNCHGGNPVRWTDIGLITCSGCHLGTGDVDDFGTGTAVSFKNGITAKVDNNEWTWSGHGKASGTYDRSGHPAAAFGGPNSCLYCHDSAVGHDNASNIYRLKSQTGVAGYSGLSWNATCMVCHSKTTSPPGYSYPGGGLKVATVGSRVDNAHFGAKHGGANDNGGAFCFDCHDPHGDRNSSLAGNVFMIGKRVSMSTDNTLGIPIGGNDNTHRPTVTFTDNATGADYADNTIRQGICQVCHTTGAVGHWTNTAPYSDGHNATAKCTTCHAHDANFKGAGGNNMEQFFDNNYRATSASNYNDLSRHPIRTDNVLFDAAQVDCYACHGVTGTAYRNNECLKCHWENRTTGTPTHPNSIFEWATPNAPATQLAAYPSGSVDNNSTLCLQCHATGGASANLGAGAGTTPTVVIPSGETWAAGSGHGNNTTKLSLDALAGPPAYQCADCHKSTVAQSGGQTRDNRSPGVHASMNRKLVRNDNATGREYPHPSDNAYATVDSRSGQMDLFCSTKCHRNLTNGQAKDDNVADHTWNRIGGEVKSGSQTHATNINMSLADPVYYKNAVALPYSEWFSGGYPGTGNAVCVTCHNPHGGGDIRDSVNVPVTPIGAKNMLRLSPADNVSTLCKECHG
jgi:predicted CxxxxCH...CXXCH cytochrome family protein